MTPYRRRDLLAGATTLALAGPLAAARPAAHAASRAGAKAVADTSGDAAAQTLLDEIAGRLVAEYPENATYYGIDKGDRANLRGQLTDRSAIGERARAEWARTMLPRLRAIDRDRLSPARAIDVDVAEEAFRLAIAGWQFPFGDMAVLSGSNSFRNSPYVFTQLSGAVVDVPDFLDSKHRVETREDADFYLARLEAFAAELRAESARFATDQAKGTLAPDFLIDLMQTQRIVASYDPPAKWGVVESLRRKCAAAGLPDRYAARAEALCTEKLMPALDQQMDMLRIARGSAWSEPGVWKQPHGEDYYAWALRAATTSAITPAEAHAQGLEMVAKLHGEMDGLLKAQGLAEGTVGARMTALSKRPDLLFANDENGRAKLLAYLNGRIDDIRGRMPRAFATLVKGDLIIKRVPEAIQDGAPSGYAAPGSIDGSLPGIYYINLKDTHDWPRYSLPTLCYHEGIPGHVWQGEYANRLPLIRTHLAFNAYSEGWGLYAEQLGDELGAYDGDPFGRLGYLQSIVFRACRLVVDTGLHAKRWGFDQAVDWFQANTGMPVASLRGEVMRYCAIPGQACGYKVGHNQINMARLRARTMLGARFDGKRFNDAIVLSGNVPLTMLPRIVDRYIAGASSGPA